MWWVKASRFVRENQLYVLMVLFIVAANIFAAKLPMSEREEGLIAKKQHHRYLSANEIAAREKRIKEVIAKDKPLALTVTVSTFACAMALMAGLILGVNCLVRKLNGQDIMVAYGSPPDARWGFTDIFRVAAAFYFLGYVIQMGAAILIGLLNVKNVDDKLFMVAGATAMDFIWIGIIGYFLIEKFNVGFKGVGVSFNNLKRDIRVGLGGYLTLIPVLAVIMLVVIVLLRILNFQPTEPTSLELMYDAKGPHILAVLTVLVTLIGPVAEELFFRGFAYPVVRRRLGAGKSILLVSFVFAALHMNVVSFFPIFALGILLAYLYEKTGSLIPAITVHIIHNSAVVFFVFLYRYLALPG